MLTALTRLRDWWHSPIAERLDAIERNTRPVRMAIEKPERVLSRTEHAELAKRMR